MGNEEFGRRLKTYGKAAVGHIRRARRVFGYSAKDINLNDLVASVSMQRHCLKPASVRIYRQQFHLAVDLLGQRRGMSNSEMDNAKSAISAVLDQLRGKPEVPRTSSKKLKFIESADVTRVARHIISRMTGEWDETLGPLVLMLAIGPLLGVRPIEWLTARLAGNVLILQNAKSNASRGSGATREMDLSTWPAHHVRGVELLCAVMCSLDPSDFARLYSRMAERLATACKQVGVPRLSPYLARNLALTNWEAAGLTPECIAALAGHRSIASQAAYISKGRGVRPAMIPQPLVSLQDPKPSVSNPIDDSEFEMPMPPLKSRRIAPSWQEHVQRFDARYGSLPAGSTRASKSTDDIGSPFTKKE